jgi:spore maturation protein CgeB
VPQPGQINVAWLISHPDEVAVQELLGFDHVFVASDVYAAKLRKRMGSRVSPLLQCTDSELFFPDRDNAREWPALFVGNSRGERRPMVEWALEAGIDFALFGSGWEAGPAKGHLVDSYVPNVGLRRYYSGAAAVLCDHWPDMRDEGFIANRLFDAAACGARIVTDEVEGLDAVFGPGVMVVRSPDELRACLEGLRRSDASDLDALREGVLQHHTFDHRIASILARVHEML